MDRSVKTVRAVPANGIKLSLDALAFSVWAFLIVKRAYNCLDFV